MCSLPSWGRSFPSVYVYQIIMLYTLNTLEFYLSVIILIKAGKNCTDSKLIGNHTLYSIYIVYKILHFYLTINWTSFKAYILTHTHVRELVILSHDCRVFYIMHEPQFFNHLPIDEQLTYFYLFFFSVLNSAVLNISLYLL